MEFVVYGVDYHHKGGEFCLRKRMAHYFISCFRTDYVAEIGADEVLFINYIYATAQGSRLSEMETLIG